MRQKAHRGGSIRWVIMLFFTILGIAVTFSGGFWFGQLTTDSRLSPRLSELEKTKAALQSQLEANKEKNDKLIASTEICRNSRQQYHEGAISTNREPDNTADQSNKSNSCLFIQEQIRATLAEINRPERQRVLSNEKEAESEEHLRKTALEQRLARYQSQLSLCSSQQNTPTDPLK